MDAGYTNKTRMFPSYTTEQLKKAIEEGVTEVRTKENLELIKLEVKNREAGISKPFKTPQI